MEIRQFEVISYFIAAIPYGFVLYHFFTGILKPKFRTWQTVLGVLAYILALSLPYVFISTVSMSFTTALIATLLFSLLFHGDIRHRLICVAAFLLLQAIAEALVFVFFSYFLNAPDYESLSHHTLNTFWGNLASKFLFLLFMKLTLKFYNRRRPQPPYLSGSYWITAFLVPLSSIVVLGVLLESTPLSLFVVAAALGMVAINLSVYVMTDKIHKDYALHEQNLELTRQNEVMFQRYDALMEHNLQFSQFKHDLKDHLSVLHSLIAHGSTDRALELLEELTGKTAVQSGPADSGNLLIDTLINSCAENSQAKWKVLLHVPQQLSIAPIDLTSVLGCVLNNAAEAAQNIPDACIEVEIRYKAEALFISVTNPYHALRSDSGGKLLSTKGIGRGMGLRNIEQIAQKYDGLSEITCVGNLFRIEILLNHITIPSDALTMT